MTSVCAPCSINVPDALSLGTIKLVGIARTIIANPGIVLLDEPAAGLDERERRELAEVIRQIADRHGIAVVVVEHDMALILNTCDRIVVLDFGQKIADGSSGRRPTRRTGDPGISG